MRKLSVTYLTLGLALGMVGCGTGGSTAELPPTPSAPAGTAHSFSCTTPGSPATDSGAFVRLGQAAVGGRSCAVLTTTSGQTLYYNKLDTATTVACSGDCTKTWRPYHLSAGTPTGPAVPGKLSVSAGANGPVVQYNGHPLYRYSGDSVPGDAKGQGVEGNWFVATPDLWTQ